MSLSHMPPDAFEQMMVEVLREAQRRQSAEVRQDYRTPEGIVRFVREVLKAEPTPYQVRILEALVTKKRVAVRGPHGLGKTALSSWVVLWVMYAFDDDVKVVTTASAWRQLLKFTWPEIRKWSRRVQWNPRPRMLDTAIKLPGKEAFAVASDDPALIEGTHASIVAYVFDEAKAIVDGVWDAAEGAFSGAGFDTHNEAYALAISTPGEPSGRFYDIHTRKPGLQDWHCVHVTLDEAIAAGRISQEWVQARRDQWGEASAVFQNRVLGEFAKSGEDSVIPLAWIEQAVERWEQIEGRYPDDAPIAWGVDPARYGTDKTAIICLRGSVANMPQYTALEDLMQTTGRVAAQATRFDPIGVDVIGIGAGVVDRLKEMKFNVTGVNASKAAQNEMGRPLHDRTDTFEFLNMRAWLWWQMREWLDPSNNYNPALPPDDRLIGDLAAPRYEYTSNGRIKIESKQDLRVRLGRSTDSGDALALALHVANEAAGRAGAGVRRAKVKRSNWDNNRRNSPFRA